MTRVVTPIALTLLFLTGCHSAYVEANVHNATGGPVTLLEVDYPSASFGKDELAADANFHYRFKILGSGPTKVTWTDARHHELSLTGPQLYEGQQGSVSVSLAENKADWKLSLTPIH